MGHQKRNQDKIYGYDCFLLFQSPIFIGHVSVNLISIDVANDFLFGVVDLDVIYFISSLMNTTLYNNLKSACRCYVIQNQKKIKGIYSHSYKR